MIPYPADEVIQVWTHDPVAVDRMRAVCKTKSDGYCPHSGERMGWKVDTDIPMFGENRDYIESLLAIE